MPGKSRKFIATLAPFFATTIGVGIFALPYTYQNAFPTSILVLIGTGLILMSLYTMYINILLERGIGIHQLPGIAAKIWGKKVKNIVALLLLLGRTGIMLLYTIILANFGSIILEKIFHISISPILISTVVTFLTSISIAFHVRFRSRIELYLSIAIIGIIGVISSIGIMRSLSTDPSITLSLLSSDSVLNGTSFLDSMGQLGKIYGVTIGALSGIVAIPALKEISKDKNLLIKTTRVGTVMVMVLYALFALFVITSSDTVTQDALHGLGDHWWVTILAIGGFISILTSYIGVGNSLFEVYFHDYSLPRIPAWLLTLLPSLILFYIGIANFTDIAAFIGGIIGGTEGLIILACYWKLESSQNDLPMSKKIPVVLTAFILGIGLLLAL